MATVNREREFLKLLLELYSGVYRVTWRYTDNDVPYNDYRAFSSRVRWEAFNEYADLIESIRQEIVCEPALPAVCPIITEEGEG